MTEDKSKKDRSNRINNRIPPVNRRWVLQGMAALGLSGAAVGTAAAEEEGWEPGDGKPPWAGDEHEEEDDDSAVPSSIQLYTLRNLPSSTAGLIRRIGAVDDNGGPGYDAVEFAGLDGGTSEIKTALEETGIDAPSAHVGLGPLEGSSFEDTVQTYKELGVDSFVVPYIGSSSVNTVEKVKNLAKRFNDTATRLEKYDARLGYHNHNAMFQTLGDGRTAFEVFAENLNESVIFEIDVGWVLTAGYDPAKIIQKYSDRTELIHMKDMKNGNFYEIGEGEVDFAAVAQVARDEANVDYFVYEHDQPEDPASSAATGAGVLSLLDGTEGPECIELSEMGGPGYNGDLGRERDEDEDDDSDDFPFDEESED